VQEFHIDGFRFDLGVTLGRELHGFDPGCGFFDALLQDPVLASVKLISEPWDIGPGGYQVGNHPAGFGEWNGRYRDDMRRYWKGDPGLRGAIAARLQGSADMFDHHRRRPSASVNFVTAHDGFTLQDLVSYNDKHNAANGEDNNDGTQQNDSYNWGVEGSSDDPNILAQREQIKRNFFASTIFSLGTPMLLAGDEFGQTQSASTTNSYRTLSRG
jgi:glycogen operon protein